MKCYNKYFKCDGELVEIGWNKWRCPKCKEEFFKEYENKTPTGVG